MQQGLTTTKRLCVYFITVLFSASFTVCGCSQKQKNKKNKQHKKILGDP